MYEIKVGILWAKAFIRLYFFFSFFFFADVCQPSTLPPRPPKKPRSNIFSHPWEPISCKQMWHLLHGQSVKIDVGSQSSSYKQPWMFWQAKGNNKATGETKAASETLQAAAAAAGKRLHRYVTSSSTSRLLSNAKSHQISHSSGAFWKQNLCNSVNSIVVFYYLFIYFTKFAFDKYVNAPLQGDSAWPERWGRSSESSINTLRLTWENIHLFLSFFAAEYDGRKWKTTSLSLLPSFVFCLRRPKSLDGVERAKSVRAEPGGGAVEREQK